MWTSAFWWLFFNLLSVVVLAFYSMVEMACVSFNKVRLHYYVNKGYRRAIWLNYLLQHPFRLFGTTLIGVNVAMVIGSECSREFHSAIGLSPDLAPLTQVALVVVFGELAPMFAARHYAEHVAILGIPLLYASAKIMTPFLWVVGIISKFAMFFVKKPIHHGEMFLSQGELQKVLEAHGEETVGGTDTEEFNRITTNIFQIRKKDASKIAQPIRSIPRLPSNATVEQMRQLLKRTDAPFVPIFYKDLRNIVGIAFPRDLLRASDTRRVRDYARPPWFVTEHTKLSQILQQFRRNKQNVAIILDRHGKATGIITLEMVLEELYGEGTLTDGKKSLLIIDRTFPGDMLVKEFNQEFDVILDKKGDQTLSELFINTMGMHPEEGDTVFIDPFELTAKETTLLEVKSITIKTRVK